MLIVFIFNDDGSIDESFCLFSVVANDLVFGSKFNLSRSSLSFRNEGSSKVSDSFLGIFLKIFSSTSSGLRQSKVELGTSWFINSVQGIEGSSLTLVILSNYSFQIEALAIESGLEVLATTMQPETCLV